MPAFFEAHFWDLSNPEFWVGVGLLLFFGIVWWKARATIAGMLDAKSIAIQTDLAAAFTVECSHRHGFGFGLAPLLTKGAEGEQHRDEIAALGGETVLVTQRTLAIGLANNHAVGLKAPQPRGQHLRRRAGLGQELIKARRSKRELPHEQDRPAVAHQRA